MKKVAIITTIIASVLLSSASVMADSRSNDRHARNDRGNDHRVTTQSIRGVNPARIELRIVQGVKSGQLTTSEVRQLQAGLNSLKATLRAVYKDHKITKWEENHAQKKDNLLNLEVTKLLNNRVTVKQHRGTDRNYRH